MVNFQTTDINFHAEADLKDLRLSSDFNYLLSFTSYLSGIEQKIYIWNCDAIAEGQQLPDAVLKTPLNTAITCMDSICIENNWFVIAGSLSGEIVIWKGKIEKDSGAWELGSWETIPINNVKDQYHIQHIDLQKESDQIIIYKIAKSLSSGLFELLKIRISPNSLSFEIEVIFNSEIRISAFDVHHACVTVGLEDGSLFEINESRNTRKFGLQNDTITKIKYINSENIIANSDAEELNIWSLEKGEIIQSIHHDKLILDIDYNPIGNEIIYTTKDRTIESYNLNDRLNSELLNLNKLLEHHYDEYRAQGFGYFFPDSIKILPNNKSLALAIRNFLFVVDKPNFINSFVYLLQDLRYKNSDLFGTLQGMNLIQVADKLPAGRDSERYIYDIIKNRLLTDEKIGHKNSGQDQKELILNSIGQLGPLFMYEFIIHEKDIDVQREYINSVREYPLNYWTSKLNSHITPEKQKWSIQLFISTNKTRVVEGSGIYALHNKDNKREILLKNRKQTLIQFILKLDNFHAGFIPLIKNIAVDIENDKGQKDTLMFSDYSFSSNLENSLLGESAIFSISNFKLDGSYKESDFAYFWIRNIKVNFVESLIPKKSWGTIAKESSQMFKTFRRNFMIPNNPEFRIQIGKGISSIIGKLIDEYFGRLILLNFIFSVWGFWEAAVVKIYPDSSFIQLIATALAFGALAYTIYILLEILIKKIKA